MAPLDTNYAGSNRPFKTGAAFQFQSLRAKADEIYYAGSIICFEEDPATPSDSLAVNGADDANLRPAGIAVHDRFPLTEDASHRPWDPTYKPKLLDNTGGSNGVWRGRDGWRPSVRIVTNGYHFFAAEDITGDPVPGISYLYIVDNGTLSVAPNTSGLVLGLCKERDVALNRQGVDVEGFQVDISRMGRIDVDAADTPFVP